MLKTIRKMADDLAAYERSRATARLVQRLEPRIRRDIGIDPVD
jgi:hypothetical protein